MAEQRRNDLSIEDTEWLDCIALYCNSVCKSFSEDSKLAVMHLITSGHISKYTIIRHLAYEMYPEKLMQNKNHTAAVVDIAVTLGVSERTIWAILNRQGIHIRKKR